MESIVTALVTGVLTLVGVLVSNSRSRAVIECKLDQLSDRVDKHNQVVERTFLIERKLAVAENDIETLYKRTEGNHE